MHRLAVVALLVGGVARAQPAPCDTTCEIERIRELLAKGDAAGARDRLVELYNITGQADLLFALGQGEPQLEHYDAALGHYEKVIPANPRDDHNALAQQAS